MRDRDDRGKKRAREVRTFRVRRGKRERYSRTTTRRHEMKRSHITRASDHPPHTKPQTYHKHRRDTKNIDHQDDRSELMLNILPVVW